MVNPFFERLGEYFQKVGSVLKGESDVASIFPNPSDIGDARELIYVEFLKQHLPKSCAIHRGGFLFGMEGNVSNQIDVIILNDLALQFSFNNQDGKGKSFACIDGCVAIASIKSNLTKREIFKALDNIASIPNKQELGKRKPPNLMIKNYDDWPLKIIYASDGIDHSNALKAINEYYLENPVPVNKQPDFIHVCGKYNIIHTKEQSVTRDGARISPNCFLAQPKASDAYSLLYTICKIQNYLQNMHYVLYSYTELVNKLPE